MKTSVLIIEDNELVRDSLAIALRLEGCEVSQAPDGPEGLELLARRSFDLALIDLRLPSANGISVLEQAKVLQPGLDVIMMTSFGTVETAVEAMKLGAAHYLTKPINDDELKIILRRLEEARQLRQENKNLREELGGKQRAQFHNLIGQNSKMQKIYSIIQAISDTDTTVLLRGESGTGKGMIAQAIHYSDPARKDGPYVEVSCGAIPRELLESELFGHVRGAFTSAIRDRMGRFELANGGTILLDEIDSLPPYLQVKLLRVLQQKEFERVGDTKTVRVDVRIIASTNRDLAAEIAKGQFREDLYYRLNVITIDVPPLRDRKEDVPSLVKHFLNAFNQKARRSLKSVSSRAMQRILDYDWPGNVRELENFLERAVVLSTGEILEEDVFPEYIGKTREEPSSVAESESTSLKEVMKEPEKQIIKKVLDQVGWNRKKAASLLDINRTTLYNKMKEYQLL